jgi:metallopeptidase MepB
MSSSLATGRPPLTPPQAPIKWDHTAQYIKTTTEEEISLNRKLHDSVAALKPEECNFKSVFEALAHGDNRYGERTSPLDFYSHVTTDDDVRAAAIAAEETKDKYDVETEMRVDVYEAVTNAEKNTDKSQLTPEQKRLLEKRVLTGKRAGLALPEEKREKLKKVRNDRNLF